jgi:hypothetical protein
MTNARNVHHCHNHIRQHDVGTRHERVRTPHLRYESRWLHPVCVAIVALWCQHVWDSMKYAFHANNEAKARPNNI